MQNDLVRKGLVIGIIILFIGTNVVPRISGNIEKIKEEIPLYRECIEEHSRIDINPEQNIFSMHHPHIEWWRTFGAQWSIDAGQSVRQTTDGGYIIVGCTESFGAGGTDIWLIKTDSNGIKKWDKTFGGTGEEWGYSVDQCTDEGYILTGYTTSYGSGGYDIVLIKTDTNGNKQWDKTFGGTNEDWGFSVQQTTDGGYIVLGHTISYGAGSSDVWLIKTDPNGNEVWNFTFGGTSRDWGFSVQQTTDGGYAITGSTESFDAAGREDVWLIKTDENGNEQWNKTFGGSNDDCGESIDQTIDDGYIVAGYTESYGAGGEDVWLIKVDINGNEEWNKTFGGSWWDIGYSVQQTTDGGYIVAGITESFSSPEGYSDCWLIKTDSDGNDQWNLVFGWPLLDEVYSVQQTADNGYIMTGYTENGDAFGSNVWLIKVAPEGENQPPNKPSIQGPTNGDVGVLYNYTFVATDSNGDDIYYYIKWGDFTNSGWIGPYSTGEEVTVSHKWLIQGSYTIRAKAKDNYGAESSWGTLKVTMPVDQQNNQNTPQSSPSPNPNQQSSPSSQQSNQLLQKLIVHQQMTN